MKCEVKSVTSAVKAVKELVDRVVSETVGARLSIHLQTKLYCNLLNPEENQKAGSIQNTISDRFGYKEVNSITVALFAIEAWSECDPTSVVAWDNMGLGALPLTSEARGRQVS